VRNWVLNSDSGTGINGSPDYDKKTKKVSRKIIKNKKMTIFLMIYLHFHHITADQVQIKFI